MVERQLKPRGIEDRRVLRAMATVPREEFVPADVRHLAYIDSPLPVGEGQTISQPYIVALMTQLAEPEPTDRALEVGTGSGYQAAVLAELVAGVFSIEIVEPLGREAAQRLGRMRYDNLSLRIGDGYAGWPEEAPFDIILVTAAAPRIPEALIGQLADGGRLVVPIGRPDDVQVLTLVRRQEGRITRTEVLSVRFVPMTGRIQKPGPGGPGG